jgi:putative ABC transport system ATP-binding protein
MRGNPRASSIIVGPFPRSKAKPVDLSESQQAVEGSLRFDTLRVEKFSLGSNLPASRDAGTDKSAHTAKGDSMIFRRKNQDIAVPDGAIVHASSVTKTYDTGTDRLTALRGIDFTVQRGEMVAVMGPSGCGKTTLLNALSGLDDIDTGSIWLDGSDLARMSDKKRTAYRAKRMGFIFQVFNLLPVLTAVENVEMPLLLSGVRPREAREKALAALERVGLAGWENHRPAELSGGQRQRVTIARSLVNDPAIVWADEPTGALDSHTADEIVDLLRTLNMRNGLTLVVVTHDAAVGQRCDRIVTMLDGEITGQTAPGQGSRHSVHHFEPVAQARETVAV